jgi:TonB family protein
MPKRVLLIDYEPRSVERLRAVVSPEFDLTVAHDGEEGLSLFSSSGRFDAVLVAGMLPRLASGEVIREIRRKGGATAPPILLMVSGYKGTNPKADAQRVGAFDILVKPFSDDDLRRAVRGAIEATDVGAKTMRIPLSAATAAEGLTASDIFSDVLKEVASDVSMPEPPRAPAASPRPAPAAPPKPAAESDVEKRLRDTLSGMLGSRGTVKTPTTPPPSAPPGATPPPGEKSAAASHAKFSANADIDRMISDTLSGLTPPPRPRAASDKTPPPAVSPPPGPAAPAEPPRPRAAAASVSPAAPKTPPKIESRPGAPASGPEPARAPEPPPVSSGPDRFGQYEILERIASGGMAELYKARRSGVEGFQKIVAIKKILPHLADNEGFIAMFADEAKLAAQLNHPNIVHIYDLGKIDGGGYFIAMEHVEGRDLRAILESARELAMPLPVPLAVYVASKVASALDYAHRRRDADGRDLHIVHRDVSPQNILISYEGDIKLCDFGIAKAASKVSQTESGALKGKIQYMSPEQAWGKPIDRRSDLFSLGAVLYELLTEQKLFRGDSDLTVLEKVRAAVVPAPSSVNSEVPKALDAIVAKALAKEPEERYANASDLLRDLESVLYSYTPAPGSADLAIFLHRLQAEEAAVAEAKAREAARAVPEAEVEPKPKRGKAAPVARRTATQPKVATPPPKPAEAAAPPSGPSPVPPAASKPTTAPGIFGTFDRPAEREGRSRATLYGMIAVAVVVLAAGAFFVTRRKPAPPPPQPTAVPATPVPVAAAPLPTAAPTIDPKKVEEEVQRQLAQKKKDLQKQLEAGKKLTPKESAPTPAQVAEAEPTEVPPTAVPAAARLEPTEAPPEPTPAPTAAPVRPSPPPEAAEPPVKRGDLVGPGPGVVEPVLVAAPKVVYPEIARQAGATGGRVVVLVLVDEEGAVSEARLQQGVSPRTGINEAVIAAIRKAHFRPATKNGVPVKMWRPVVVDVRP